MAGKSGLVSGRSGIADVGSELTVGLGTPVGLSGGKGVFVGSTDVAVGAGLFEFPEFEEGLGGAGVSVGNGVGVNVGDGGKNRAKHLLANSAPLGSADSC